MRKICILTGTRADYGLLRRLILEAERSSDAELQLVVSGTHLTSEHGRTSGEISNDALVPAAEVPIWSGDDSSLGAAEDFGSAVGGFARALDGLNPDIVVILGDRLEALAMATAATVLSVPIAHVHGGEITEGAMDDVIRHAITKLSYLHFASTEEHRQRIIQLGEEPERVFNLGAPVVDAIADLKLLSRAELERQFSIRLGNPTALMTFHPAAMDVLPARELVSNLLSAIREVPDLHVIITGTNSDIGSAAVRAMIRRFVSDSGERVDYVESFGQLGYLSAMALSDVVIGNSSSTVLEAPVLGIPSVLIGDRQAGRPVSPSVIVPKPTEEAIALAIKKALTEEFRSATQSAPLPFGAPGFAHRALTALLECDVPRPARKHFWDIKRSK
ncbi:MAG: UDP-N-acetylglucosamine 2-epimerase [Homoserinimonas sp.]